MYYVCMPPSFGTLGPRSRLDLTTNPPSLLIFEYALETMPLGQDIIASGSAADFLVSDKLARCLLREGFRGYQLGTVSVSTGSVYSRVSNEELTTLNQYSWLKVIASNYDEDFSLVRQRLVVNQRLRDFLQGFNMTGCSFTDTMSYDFDGTSRCDELRRETSERLKRLEFGDFAGII